MRRAVFLFLIISALGLAAIWLSGRGGDEGLETAYSAPELEPLKPLEAARTADLLTDALLRQVYDGFAQTGEEAIYDTLAVAVGKTALETLYLERAGALARTGLEGADQTVHDMRVTRISAKREGVVLLVDATWQVLATVGHEEHKHARGNSYRADLRIEPIDGRWAITDFSLTDVDRTTASGEPLPSTEGDNG